jgi:sulfite exporter TauE/SafE
MMAMAFGLGFFGSWHCLGMCGPIALGVKPFAPNFISKLVSSLSYNMGRVVSYGILGLIFGLFGNVINIAGAQQWLSIIAGIFLIVLFIFSLDLEHYLYRFKAMKQGIALVQTKLTQIQSKTNSNQPIVIGVINGFLPCGMVYLALAGAVLQGTTLGGIQFMVLFGLGTIPAMFSLMSIEQFFKGKFNLNRLRNVLPVLQLFLGIYLIYRGLAIDFPDALDFNLAIKNPIWCH